MTPADCLQSAIIPALETLGEKFQGPRAEVMLLTISQQESGLRAIQQLGGPARGLWQFEQHAIDDVLTRRGGGTMFHAQTFCEACSVPANDAAVYAALLTNDVLAAGFARLKLWAMPEQLPSVGDVDGAWQFYVNCWHPGKPKPDSWPTFYRISMSAIGAATP